uniref:Uncharacterized protein n=1 Tax=Vannella robusta TaxID=1487602 RepID=A0A7S4HI00_9EUKA
MGLYVLLAAVSPMFAASIPLIISKTRKELPNWVAFALLGLSSGMLFAVATLDLIPEGIQVASDQAKLEWSSEYLDTLSEDDHAHERSPEETSVKLATMGIFFGFILMMIVEQTMSYFGAGHSHQQSGEANPNHSHDKDDTKHSHGSNQILSSSFSLAALAGLGVHSFVDGVMIGGAFSASASVGARVGIAIVLHKFPDGFMLSSIIQTMKMPTAPARRGKYFFENLGFFILAGICLMTPIGAILSFTVLEGMPDTMLGFVLCLGSGTFLFITCSGIIPELLHQGSNRMLTVGTFVSGYFLFLITDTLFHAH